MNYLYVLLQSLTMSCCILTFWTLEILYLVMFQFDVSFQTLRERCTMITMRAFEILHFFMNEFDVGPSVATLCECLITQRTWKTSNAEMHYSYVCFDVSSIVT